MKIIYKIFQVIEGSDNGNPFGKVLPAMFLKFNIDEQEYNYIPADEFETEELAIKAIRNHGEQYCNYTIVKIIKT